MSIVSTNWIGIGFRALLGVLMGDSVYTMGDAVATMGDAVANSTTPISTDWVQ